MVKKQEELEGMPERKAERVLTFLGAKTDPGRKFGPREVVRYEIEGYVQEQGTRYLQDEDTPLVEFTKIQTITVKEIK